jgi:sporulation and spore germination protein
MRRPAGTAATPPRGRLSLLAVLLLAGCGVPADDQPRDLAHSQVAYGSDAPAPDRFGPAVERLYLVGDGELVRVVRRTPAPRSPAQMVQDLVAGPTRAEQQDGLTSALAQMRVGSTSVSQRRAAVEIGAPPVPGARSDEALAYAQIVCTLTSQGAEVGTVSFTRDGQTLAVPRGDGSLSTGPLTIADYAELIRS